MTTKYTSFVKKAWVAALVLTAGLVTAVEIRAGTFGTVVPIGGQASDIALDESRGLLYIANFTANRIELMSTSDNSVHSSLSVAPQPGAMALSPDGQFLVVIHFGNFQTPIPPSNALTVINLNTNVKQTFALGYPPLGIAFCNDGQAFIVTTNDFLLLEPASGALQVIDTVAGVMAKTLPVALATFPPQIISASVTASADGLWIYGLTDTIRFSYSVRNRLVVSAGYTSSPAQGPRVVSVSHDGSYFAAGWGLFDPRGRLLSQFLNPSGQLNIGSHAIDSAAQLIYAQIPEAQTTPAPVPGSPPPATPATPPPPPPVLMVLDAGNLTIRERLKLPENLAGRSILASAGDVLFAVSDSGVLVLPVGSLNNTPRVTASREDMVFRGSFCDRRPVTQEIAISNPGGGNTDFSLSTTTAGITISPAAGVTPATVRVSVDPSIFQNQKGTVLALIQIRSSAAANIPPPIRVLINNREPEQRGTFVNVPGKLVDMLADPFRDRFYILRQDRNQVLVFDGSTYNQIATLRTANTPTQMAITFDRRYLLVGHENAQLLSMYDLDTLETLPPVMSPPGHYPHAIASSGNAILAASRVAGPIHTIDRVDLVTRSAVTPPSLGVFQNNIHLNTTLVASPNGSSILAAMADGNLLLYNANADTFTASRKDFPALSGAYAASSYDQFVVDNNVLNSSLVLTAKLENATGASSGFAFMDQTALRSTTASAQASGVMERVDLAKGNTVRPTRTAESPLPSDPAMVFTRTLAPLYSRNAIVSLSISGFTILSWDYDTAVAPPYINQVVNAADQSGPVAPGGLIMVRGSQFSAVNIASNELPLPTALGESCLAVNGVPVPMLFASPNQINGQLPFNVDGNATMTLRTPGGASNNYNFTILPTAPSVFRTGAAGPDSGLATIVRARNNELATLANPIHRGDSIIIYATGMGRTNPAIEAGVPASADPLPTALIPPTLTLGGMALSVAFAGLAPGEVGVYQINATVPGWAPMGMAVPLIITQGASSTTVDVRVVD